MKHLKPFSISLISLISLLIFHTSFANESGHALDSIIAVVNNEVITQSQLDHAFNLDKQQFEVNGIAIPDVQAMKKRILQQLIDQRLEMQLAKRNNVTASDKEVDEAIERIAKQNHMTSSDLKAKLLSMGVTDQAYKKQIHDQIIMAKIQQKAVGSTVNITQSDMDAFKKSYAKQDNGTTQYHVADILVAFANSTPSPTDINDTEKKAQALLAQIKTHHDFDKIMNDNSGSDLGWRRLQDFPAVFASPVSRMNINEISQPIRAPNGFHLLKLLDRNGQNKNLSHEELQNMTFQQKFEAAVQKWLLEMRKAAYVKIEKL